VEIAETQLKEQEGKELGMSWPIPGDAGRTASGPPGPMAGAQSQQIGTRRASKAST